MSTRASTAPARRFAFLIIAAVMLLALPSVALGAKGNQNRIEVSSAALIGTVSPGETLAFRASFVNHGPGTITHVRFEGSAAGGSFVSSSHGCSGAGAAVACDLGTFAAGSRIDLTLVFTGPSSGGVSFNGAFSGDAGSGNNNAASTDVWPVNQAYATVDTSAEFFGRWQAPHPGPQAFAPIGTGSQVTSVTADPFPHAYAAMLRHTTAPITCTNSTQLGGANLSGFGMAVDMTVAAGQTGVDVTVRYASGTVSKPLSKIAVVHQRDDGSCTLPPRCDGSNAGNCFTASYEGHGSKKDLVIRIQLPHNGRIKGI